MILNTPEINLAVGGGECVPPPSQWPPSDSCSVLLHNRKYHELELTEVKHSGTMQVTHSLSHPATTQSLVYWSGAEYVQ